eukprot:7567265-Pyramimonas_sp.AAC.1
MSPKTCVSESETLRQPPHPLHLRLLALRLHHPHATGTRIVSEGLRAPGQAKFSFTQRQHAVGGLQFSKNTRPQCSFILIVMTDEAISGAKN